MRVLIIEDSIDDAELLVRELRKGGARVEFERVETATALTEAIERRSWDVVLADYTLPELRGDEALRIVKGRDPDLPFIFVSGTIGEEIAVALVKAGANDYVMKRNLVRLPVSVAQQLDATKERRARRRSDETLRESEERFRQMAESIGDVFFLMEADNSRIHYVSPAYEKIWGRSCASLYAAPESFTEAIHPDDRAAAYENYRRGLESGEFSYQYRIVRPDGSIRWIEARGFPVRDAAGARHRIAGVYEDITERVRMRAALEEREAGLRRAQSLAKLGHIVTGPGGSFESWSESLPGLIGLEPAQMPRSTGEWLNMVHRDERGAFRARILEAAATGSRWDTEYRFKRGDGVWISVRQVIEPLRGEREPGDGARWFSTLQDVTEQRQAEARVKRLNRVYAVLSGINAAIVRIRDRQALFQEACRIAVEEGGFGIAWIGVFDPQTLEVTPAAWAGLDADFIATAKSTARADVPQGQGNIGRAIRERRPVYSNDISKDGNVGGPRRREALRRGYRSLIALPLLTGAEVWGTLALFGREAGFFDDAEVKLLAEMAGDISFALEMIDKDARLDYLAYHDVLTGLPNRRLLRDRLDQEMRMARREQSMTALVLFDVARFKMVNDSLGRQAGDVLLKEIAARLQNAAREPSTVARLGADRFAVTLPRLRQAADAGGFVERALAECFRKPFVLDAEELRVSADAGIAVSPNDAGEPDALIHHAETALKKAKENAAPYVFYAPEMNARVAESLRLETRLRRALENDELVLHYQPKVDIRSRAITGLEALMRWNDPESGLVPPATFIPLMERTRLILEAGQWAIGRALADYARWRSQGFNVPRIAVNLSALQLRQPDFVQRTAEAIAQSGAGAAALELEITESVVMESVEANFPKLQALRQAGVQIAIDDFGTGYSSLAYVARLPVHALKIDRAFIRDLTSSPDSVAVVKSIISLAHSLGLKLVAEGVETEEQASFLGLLLCDEMQGYLFSPPVPPQQIEALLN